jgi:hypothetical protein
MLANIVQFPGYVPRMLTERAITRASVKTDMSDCAAIKIFA